MSDELRKVDRVMLETLATICETMELRRVVGNRGKVERQTKEIRALLTEQPGPGSGNKQPEQDEAGEQRLAFGDAACPDCHGEGNDIHYVCRTCDGSGLVPTSVPPYEERAKAKPVEPDAPQELLRAICETEVADPKDERTVCLNYDDLAEIIKESFARTAPLTSVEPEQDIDHVHISEHARVIEQRDQYKKQRDELLRLIKWTLGESPGGLPDWPERLEGQGAFYWRIQLRELLRDYHIKAWEQKDNGCSGGDCMTYMELAREHGAVIEQRDQYKEKLDTLVGLVRADLHARDVWKKLPDMYSENDLVDARSSILPLVDKADRELRAHAEKVGGAE